MVLMADLHIGECPMLMLLFDFSEKQIFSSNDCRAFLTFGLMKLNKYVTINEVNGHLQNTVF